MLGEFAVAEFGGVLEEVGLDVIVEVIEVLDDAVAPGGTRLATDGAEEQRRPRALHGFLDARLP